MLGPSGFFLAPENVDINNNDIELIHSSEDGFNELYRVCKNGRFFVYKALKPEYRGKAIFEDLMEKDFNIGFTLNHSNICQYYAKIQHPEAGTCIVMEWIDGCTLESLLRSGNISTDLARKIICEICDALDYIHRKQIIHRDLKPENILITHNGQNVKIIDFGLSDTDSYGVLKEPAGTRIYASPELVAGEQIDLRSDIWSLGMIINEINRKYHRVATRCCHREQDKRYASASEVKKAILGEPSRKLKLAIGWVVVVAAIVAAAALSLNKPTHHIDTTYSQTSPIPDSAADTISENPSTEKPTEQAPAIKKEPALQPTPITSQPESSKGEKINSQELEDLFNSAAQSIL